MRNPTLEESSFFQKPAQTLEDIPQSSYVEEELNVFRAEFLTSFYQTKNALIEGVDISLLVPPNQRSCFSLIHEEFSKASELEKAQDIFNSFKLLFTFYSLSRIQQNEDLKKIFEEDLGQLKSDFKKRGFEFDKKFLKKLKFRQRVYFADEEFEKFKVESDDLSEEALLKAQDLRVKIHTILNGKDPHQEHVRFHRERKKFIAKNSDINKENLSEVLIYFNPNKVMLEFQLDQEKLGADDDEFKSFLHEYYLRLNSYNLLIIERGDIIPSEPIKFPDGFKKSIFNAMIFLHDTERMARNFDSVFCINQDNEKSSNIYDLFLHGVRNHSNSRLQEIFMLSFFIENGAVISHKKTPEETIEIENKLYEFIKISDESKFESEEAFFNIRAISQITKLSLLSLKITQDRLKSFANEKIPSKKRKEGLVELRDFSNRISNNEKSMLSLRGFLNYIDYFGVYDFLFQHKDSKEYKEVHKSIIILIGKESTHLPIHDKIKKEEEDRKEAEKNAEKMAEELLNEDKMAKEAKENAKKIKEQKKTQKEVKAQDKKAQESLEKAEAQAKAQEEMEKKAQAEIEEKATKLIEKTSKAVQKDFEKFHPFFNEFKKESWINPTEIGIFGSRVYKKFIENFSDKKTQDLQAQSSADFDFFCISDRIFQCCHDEVASEINFQEFLKKFNEKNPNFQVRIKEAGEDSRVKKSVNFNQAKKSLNFKLVAKINGEDFDFDLNFYDKISKSQNLQWQFNGERIMASESAGKFELTVNNCNCEAGQEMSVENFAKEVQKKDGENFIFDINDGARGYLNRCLNQSGIYKYFPEQAIKSSEQILAKEYQEYRDFLRGPSKDNPAHKKRIEDAMRIVEEVEKNPFLLEILSESKDSAQLDPKGPASKASGQSLVGESKSKTKICS